MMSSEIEKPQDSEGYNRILFQQSHRAMVVFDPEARCFIDSNQAAAKIFGYSSPEEVVGKTPLDMAAPTQYDGSDSATASQRRDQSALVQGIESFEWRHQRPNGEIWDGMVHLMSFTHRGRHLLQATLEDITQRKKTEEALRESRQLLQSVLENSPAVIYAKRKDGTYTYINREWERVCGLTRDQVIGKTDHDLFPPDIAKQFRNNDLAVLQTGRLTEYEERVGTPWGEQLFLSKKVPLISPSGEVEGLSGISTNITVQRRNELVLRETVLTLERERQNRLMNVEAIVASIAHEVKQPLAAITMNANAALRFFRRVPPDYREVEAALARIGKESHRVGEVFDSIRVLFQQDEPIHEPIDANEVARETLQSLRGELEGHGVTLRTELADGLPLIQGHKNQLQQVIVNLVHNSIEAMDTVLGRSRVLLVKTDRRDSNTVIVVVEDSGPGIEAARLEGIFEPFVTTKKKGMGLGLAICRRIIENHGGKLTASSDGNSGARFQIVLTVGTENLAPSE
jgi:PAS domain S-box-containing protein